MRSSMVSDALSRDSTKEWEELVKEAAAIMYFGASDPRPSGSKHMLTGMQAALIRRSQRQ